MSKYETEIREMSENIATLLAEFKNMNGELKGTKIRFDKHDEESNNYRRKIDIIWAIIHSVKWAILILFGTGVLYKWIEK